MRLFISLLVLLVVTACHPILTHTLPTVHDARADSATALNLLLVTQAGPDTATYVVRTRPLALGHDGVIVYNMTVHRENGTLAIATTEQGAPVTYDQVADAWRRCTGGNDATCTTIPGGNFTLFPSVDDTFKVTVQSTDGMTCYTADTTVPATQRRHYCFSSTGTLLLYETITPMWYSAMTLLTPNQP